MSEPVTLSLGDGIVVIKRRLGMTYEEMAKCCRVNPNTISGWLSRDKLPANSPLFARHSLRALARKANVTIRGLQGNNPLRLRVGEDMEREAFIEEALDAMYEKAQKDGAIPWNDAAQLIPDEDVSFPDDQCPAPELDWDDI